MYDQNNFKPNNRCYCDCGTRIVIDQQLLQQRQMWKEKYLCLQKQMLKDIGQMKENIYSQCSTLMQQEFQNKEKQHAKIVNKKNIQIQQLTSKIISLQTTIKVMNRQKQLQNQKFNQIQDQIKERDTLITTLKAEIIKIQHNCKQKTQENINNFRKKLITQNKENLESLQTQNQHLKHKVKDFEKKYQILIPQVERLKGNLNEKCNALENLEQKYEKLKRDNQKQFNNLKIQHQQIEKAHGSCRGQILKLNEKIGQLQAQIRNQKKAKNQVKVQPIYIEKPVNVQKIIQKIVPVQRVIKQYVEPVQYRDEALQHEFNKLKIENDRIIKENHSLQRKFQQNIKDYEKLIHQYEANITKYKTERELLAKKIQELNKELDIVYSVKRIQNVQKQSNEPQKVTVYVKNEGISEYYSTGTTIPRIMTVNSPRTLERSTSRNTSRTKPLSTSQSTKRIAWK